MIEPDEPRKALTRHEVGQSLDTLSVEELGERLALLRAEIARIEAALAEKRASRDAAAAFFKS